ncbi:hypothetical protein GEMRC1_004228 [Eukaryota sp. GEM-RC1]
MSTTSLFEAVECNDLQLITEIVSKGASVLSRDSLDNTPLHLACSIPASPEIISTLASHYTGSSSSPLVNKLGQSPLLLLLSHADDVQTMLHCRQLLSSLSSSVAGKLVTLTDHDGLTPLHIAAMKTSSQLLAFLSSFTSTSSLNITAIDGQTPLHFAASTSLCCTEFLLSKRLALKTDGNGRSPLHFSALGSEPSIVSLLLNHTSNVDSVDDAGNTPLHLACSSSSSPQIIKLLSSALTKPSAFPLCNSSGQTPLLLLTLIFGNFDAVDALISSCNKSLIDQMLSSSCDGLLPLHVAVINSDIRVIQRLLSFSSSPPYVLGKDCGQGTALHVAVSLSHDPSVGVVSSLLSFGFPSDVTDADGRVVLHLAAQKGLIDIVNCLINYDCSVNVMDYSGNTPLLYAISFGCLRCTSLLLSNTSDTSVTNNNGDTCLHVASSKSRAMIELLLPFVEDLVNTQNNKGMTPLLLASLKSCYDSIELLLENGADPNIADYSSTFPPPCSCF